MSKGFILSMDGLLSLIVALVIFSLLLFIIRDDHVDSVESVSVSLPFYLASAQRMGYLNDVIAQTNQTLLDEIANNPRAIFCMNITVYNEGNVLLSSMNSTCVPGQKIASSSVFIYQNGSIYIVKALGWKQ